MRNKTRRMLTTGTALAMTAVFCLGGCGTAGTSATGEEATNAEENTQDGGNEATEETEETEETVNLTWLLRIPEQKDGQMVLDAANEIIQKELNANLDIEFYDPVAYPEKTKLKIASQEPFDIMFTSSGYGFYDYASKGAFVPLEDLLPKYAPKTWEMIPEEYWNAVTVDGHIYGIPNYQITARTTCMNYRTEIVEKYDLDIESAKTLEDMEPILAELKEKEPDKQYIMSGIVPTYFETMNYMGLEGIGADGSPGVIEIDGDSLEVVNQYEHPNFIQLCKTIADYEDKGYINKDAALLEDTTELMKNGEFLCGAMGNWKPGAEAENLARYGYENEYVLISEPYVNTTSILGTLQAISATSEHPEVALQLIEMVNTNPELYNTLVYGIEGEHYNMVGENRIEQIPDSGYQTNVPWMIGNTFNGYLMGDTDENVYEETKELNETAKCSRILGFNFDPEPVKTELAQCQTIVDKYVPKGFAFGMYDDVEGTLAQMNEELRAAGMDKIIAEKQAQLDKWAESNQQ